jgi:putative spermidine/putrescine transport system ATP-binding protein
MNHLELIDLTLAYGKGASAVERLNLTVARGELVSLLGPSGCGKTTTMRAVAGLLEPRGGRIVLAGEDITRVPAHRRDIGLVFQSYALFPHLSARDNVAFGLRLRRVPAAELRERVEQALRSVGLEAFADRLPANLSGGQQQRVALARAIVLRPRLLLLDEPLSNLDARLRLEMRAELRRLQRELGITMLYVTHDQDEALSLSDRIVVMNAGRIEQSAEPEAVWNRPATPFVARFMGCENLFEVGPALPVVAPPGATHLAWRATAVPLAAAHAPGIEGRVLARSYLGERVEYLVETALGRIKATGAAHRQGDEPRSGREGGAGDRWVSSGRAEDHPASPGVWDEGASVRVLLDPARAAVIPPSAAPGAGPRVAA